MDYKFISISLLLVLSSIYGEILTYTTPSVTDTIQCQDATTECIINCDSSSACSDKTIHCHATSSLPCTINLNAGSSAESGTIFTHSSSIVSINGNANDCAHNMAVHAYEQGSTQLFITTTYENSFTYANIYGPVGIGSVLWIKGGVTAFQYAKIYDDWTTTVRLQPVAYGTFKDARVYNIFDHAGLDITRDDAMYSNVDMTYRASVYLVDCVLLADTFVRFLYDGVNHGDWFVGPQSFRFFQWSTIYATTDNRVDQSVPYNIKMYGSGSYDFHELSVYAGAGANIYLDITGYRSLSITRIYAKAANSLNIYCHGTGYCDRLEIECPDNALPNSCNWICDSPNCKIVNTMSTIEIPTPDVFACDSLYLESRVFATIYCGYNQLADSCSYQSDGTDVNYTCDSVCGAQCPFDNVIAPTLIGDEIDSLCNETPITFPSTAGPTTDEPTTNEPTTNEPTTNIPTTTPPTYTLLTTTAVDEATTLYPHEPDEDINEELMVNGWLMVALVALILFILCVIGFIFKLRKETIKVKLDNNNVETEIKTKDMKCRNIVTDNGMGVTKHIDHGKNMEEEVQSMNSVGGEEQVVTTDGTNIAADEFVVMGDDEVTCE